MSSTFSQRHWERARPWAGRDHFLDKELCLSLYRTLVLPLFDFNDYIYDCLTSADAYTLQKPQNTALGSIMRVDSRTSISEIRLQAGLPLLSSRRHCHTATEMFKMVNGLSPDIRYRFVAVEGISNVSTRSSVKGDLYLLATRLQATKHSFVCRGAMTWNGLPLDVRQSTSVEEFKNWVAVIF